jgi:LysM repeat protein
MGSVRRSNWRYFLPYLGLNVLISVGAILLVLFLWSRRPTPPGLSPTATMNIAQEIETLMPTATFTLPPSPTPNLYVVKPGDTLFAIAQELDISMAVLMAANGIANADELDVGQEIIIPSEEWVKAYEEGRVGSRAQSDNTPTPQSEPPKVQISGVVGVGAIESEAIRFLNTGGPANMANWRIDDGEGHVYIFPIFTLHSGAFNLNTRSGTDTPIDLYWGLDKAILSQGKIITLVDSSGKVVSTFPIPK